MRLYKRPSFLLQISTVIIMFFLLPSCNSIGLRGLPLETLKQKYSVKDTDFINIDGLDIHYKDEGEGPTLILLHGICASLYTWDGWVEQLKDKYRIIRVDLPGWGLTGPIGEDSHKLDTMIPIMEKFVAKLGIKSFYLAGNSLGGYFSWNYAVRNPEQVKKMVLLDPVCYPQSVPWFMTVAQIPLVNIFPKVMLPKFLVSMNVDAVYSDDSKITDDIYNLYFDMAMRKGNKASYIDNFRFMADMAKKDGLSKNVEQLKMPVLLMYGEDDEWVSPEQAKLWAKDVPGVKHIIYKGVGHIPMEESPIQTAKDADKFLDNISG